MKNRTLVAGDIHGAHRALLQVLEKVRPDKTDTLIFLGDYVDGWSGAKEVVSLLLQLAERHNCIFIRGNHDTWCENWLRNGEAPEAWLLHGGAATQAGYAACSAEEKEQHLAFFSRMQHYHIDARKRLFIHAGFTSMHGPGHEIYPSNYSWDRTLWETALSADPELSPDSPFYPKRLKHFSEIYIGHTPATNYGADTPMNGLNVWNADTGAAFTGKLSIIDAGSKEYWQSDSVQTLYPGERGRN